MWRVWSRGTDIFMSLDYRRSSYTGGGVVYYSGRGGRRDYGRGGSSQGYYDRR